MMSPKEYKILELIAKQQLLRADSTLRQEEWRDHVKWTHAQIHKLLEAPHKESMRISA